MKICLIGQNLTNFILALAFAEKKISVDIHINKKINNYKTDRTIAISKKNFDYLNSLIKKPIHSWQSKEIKIYIEKSRSKEIINFKNNNKEVFNLVKFDKLVNLFAIKIKKSKFIHLNKIDKLSQNYINKVKNYDLVINSDSNNIISKKHFNNKIKKNYNSFAYTFIAYHKKKNNNIASQIFTKYGPLAFLPISNNQTSIVFSCSGKPRSPEEILKLFNYYNSFYEILKTGKIEKFNLNFFVTRNYIFKNILAFGDLIHRIHPLAGQGFNMTIRDIKSLSNIIDKKINLGLPVDISVADEFQQSTKHLNYLYGKAIDGIYEFFKIDNQFNNSLSKPIFKILNKNSSFKKYSSILSENGFNL